MLPPGRFQEDLPGEEDDDGNGREVSALGH